VYKNHSIAVVVPAYNEEQLISNTLSSIPEFVDRIYAVNDASVDGTQQVIDILSRSNLRIHPIIHQKNAGVGASVISGYKQALADGMDVTVVMDGDNQMDPQSLPFLLDPIVQNRADYTKGNRLLNPEFRRGMSKWRFLGNTILTILTKFSSGYWKLMDPQNGYTAISIKALQRINLNQIYPKYGYLNDILVKLNVFGFRVMSIEIPARYGCEKSKIKYGRYIRKVSWLLLKDFFYRLRMKYVILSFHPLVIFYLLGIVMTLIGIGVGIYTIHWVLIQHGPLFIRGVLSLLIFIFGLQFLSFALLFDIQESRDISLTDWETL
jgi:glycosyltransferase involved in cell wall biosynthesis